MAKINKRDFETIAAHIIKEYEERKGRRGELEKKWDEIDRQCEQIAIQFNRDASGRTIRGKEWQPFFEEPWQMLACELISDDVMRLLFPSPGKYFDCVGNAQTEHFDAIKEVYRDLLGYGNASFMQDMVINSDFVSKMTKSLIDYGHSLYAHEPEYLKLVIDAVKYGTCAGRFKRTRREKFSGDYRNLSSTIQEFPAIVHYPIRNVYIDDSLPAVLHTDTHTGPAHIFVSSMRVESLRRLLSIGKDDWIKSAGSELKDKKADDVVELIEMEGDFIIPREGESLYLPNVAFTVAKNANTKSIVRYQQLGPYRSWVINTYFPNTACKDGKLSPYGTSPLLMGSTVQAGGTCMFNRSIHAGILNADPPIGYDQYDSGFAAAGETLEPGKAIKTNAQITVHKIGDINALISAYQTFKTNYSDVTGISASRVGQQTKSHQTAYAIDTELSRAVIRTVEFAQRLKKSALISSLHLEYRMWLEILDEKKDVMYVYSEDFKQFIPISREMLPDEIHFTAYGVGEPQQEELDRQKRLQSIDFAAKLEQLVNQTGGQPLNWSEIRNDTLRETFGDVEKYTQQPATAPATVPSELAPNSGIPSANGEPAQATGQPNADLAAVIPTLGMRTS